jgi:hypothetical protein
MKHSSTVGVNSNVRVSIATTRWQRPRPFGREPDEVVVTNGVRHD